MEYIYICISGLITLYISQKVAICSLWTFCPCYITNHLSPKHTPYLFLSLSLSLSHSHTRTHTNTHWKWCNVSQTYCVFLPSSLPLTHTHTKHILLDMMNRSMVYGKDGSDMVIVLSPTPSVPLERPGLRIRVDFTLSGSRTDPREKPDSGFDRQ